MTLFHKHINMKYSVWVISLLMITTSINAQQKKMLTLEEFVPVNTFTPKYGSKMTACNNDKHYSMLVDSTKIVKYNYENGKEAEVILDISNIKDSPAKAIVDYELSNDEQRILIKTNPESIYRRSEKAEYYVWDLYTKRMYPVSDNGSQIAAKLSPDGERIAFVRDNNLFIKTIRFGTEYAVTNDGKDNEIINGIGDWLYEEEFETVRAFEWSPDSKSIAFIRFNEKEVPTYEMQMFKGLEPELPDNAQYPHISTVKYPKAGEKNAEVSVLVHSIKGKVTLKMDIGSDPDIYLPRIMWSPDSKDLAMLRLNRQQNRLDIMYANPNTGESRIVITEKNLRYISTDFIKQFRFLEDQRHLVVMSERNGWSHLYLYRNNGFIVGPITSGDFDVTDFYGYDQERKIFYYQAAKKSPLQREVYAISIDGKTDKTVTNSTVGTNNATAFSKSFNFFINKYSSITSLPRVSTMNSNGKELFVIEDNKTLKSKIDQYQWPSQKFFSFTSDEGIYLVGYMLKPSNFDETKKYPVIMTQYSGPNSQMAKDEWNTGWQDFVAEHGYIVVCVDSRGTAARGEEFRKCTYLQLGKLESDDLIATAKYLGSLDYIDKNNINIWGWSYGGFAAAMCMARSNGIFNTGISVAPVTDWRFYDTAYTERYMRTPRENPNGYNDASLVMNAKNMGGNYLLIHGLADDNVHIQNCFEFAEAMTQADFQFDMHTYTNRNHSIKGGNTSIHLYKKILRFFDKNIK